MEEEKATDEHDEGNRAKGDVEVSPPHVVGLLTAWWRRDIARQQIRIAGVIRNEAPCNQ